jgi:hypothetical protein
MASDRTDQLMQELTAIHEEIRALREDLKGKGVREEFDRRMQELEVEERLRQIQDEIEAPPPKKRRWFR